MSIQHGRTAMVFLLWIFVMWSGAACTSNPCSDPYSTSNSIERAGAKPLSKEQADALPKVDGYSIFVPAYSRIYHQIDELFNITTTLSINNTDMHHPIAIMAVKYYNTAGALQRDFIETPLLLPPLATLDFVVPEQDLAGGTGANFLVTWKADKPVSKPLVETVMIDGQYGISFLSRGEKAEPSVEQQSN